MFVWWCILYLHNHGHYISYVHKLNWSNKCLVYVISFGAFILKQKSGEPLQKKRKKAEFITTVAITTININIIACASAAASDRYFNEAVNIEIVETNLILVRIFCYYHYYRTYKQILEAFIVFVL